MNHSPGTFLSRRVAPAAAALAFLIAAGCPKPDSGLSTGGTATPGGGSGGGADALKISVTVNPANAEGERTASVKLEPSDALGEGQLAFELPAECRVVAGATVRQIKSLTAGTPLAQGIGFQCPTTTTGSLKATFSGKDGKGQAFQKSAEGSL